ncbi:MAG: hypothetical protein Q9172_003818, partial [Xanthocarpia lactea]
MAPTSISTSDLPRLTTISSTLSNNDTSPITVVNDDKENREDSHGNEERHPHLHSNITISHHDDDEEDDEKPTTNIANLMFLELEEAVHRNHFRLPRNELATWVPLLNKGFGGPAG